MTHKMRLSADNLSQSSDPPYLYVDLDWSRFQGPWTKVRWTDRALRMNYADFHVIRYFFWEL